MAIIFQDYFEHALGPYTPAGFTVAAFTHDIVTGGIDGGNAWQLFGTARYTASATVFTSVSLFLAINFPSTIQDNQIVLLSNVNPADLNDPINRVLLRVEGEADNTITIRAGDGQVMGNTGQPGVDFSMNASTWYFFQLNVIVDKQTVLGIDYIKLDIELRPTGSR